MMTRCPHCDIRLAPTLSFGQTWTLYRDTCAHMNIHPRKLNTKQRHQRIVEKRWIVMWILRQAGAKLSDIAEVMSRDHSTVIHGIAQIDSRLHSSEADGWQSLIQRASGKKEKVYATKHYLDGGRSITVPAGASVNDLPAGEEAENPGIQNRPRLAV